MYVGCAAGEGVACPLHAASASASLMKPSTVDIPGNIYMYYLCYNDVVVCIYIYNYNLCSASPCPHACGMRLAHAITYPRQILTMLNRITLKALP